MSRLDLVVGPNGAGKTTFVERILAPLLPNSHFVNADRIAAERWPTDPEIYAHDAAAVAEATRNALIASSEPFIAETVFSHTSKMELVRRAQTAGYHVALHVLMIPEDEAVARVSLRVTQGGHSVPEIKIRERHRRLWDLVAEAVPQVQVARFYDNSRKDGPAVVAQLVEGHLLSAPNWPNWAPDLLKLAWPT